MLPWSEKFETGNPEIDLQHKMLISYINRLEIIACNTNPDRQEAEFLLNFVDFVETYTVVHFKHEESCMVRYRCLAYQENKDAHERFLQFFRHFKQRFQQEGCRPEVLKELHDACCSWIQTHILRIDLQLKPCLEKIPPAKGE